MSENAIKFSNVEDRVIILHGLQVLVDSDVAELYGVGTKEVNQAVKNNPDKFPEGYLLEVSREEKTELVKNFDRFDRLKHSTATPTAFTEKGLYMLATILKSERATGTTIAIVETFARIRELLRNVAQIADTPDEQTQKQLMRRSGSIVADLLDEELQTTDTETSIELNLALLNVKHTVKRKTK